MDQLPDPNGPGIVTKIAYYIGFLDKEGKWWYSTSETMEFQTEEQAWTRVKQLRKWNPLWTFQIMKATTTVSMAFDFLDG